MFISLPEFKNAFEAIRHAVDTAEKDEVVKYACYGGPAHPETYSPGCHLIEIGIKLISSAGDEIRYYEDVWADAYNLACKKKKFKGYTLEDIVSKVHSFEKGKGYWHNCKTFKEFFEDTE